MVVTDVSRVLAAVKAGARTALEVEAVLAEDGGRELTAKLCCAHLGNLERAHRIVRVGLVKYGYDKGRAAIEYELARA